MRTILSLFLGSVVLVTGLSACSTTVKTDSGHAVTTGVHAH
jgi:hypothetical protein